MRFFPSLELNDYNNIVQPGDAGVIYSSGSMGTGGLAIAPWASGASGIRMDSNGNVGIGTPTPQGALHVFSASRTRILGEAAPWSGEAFVDFFAFDSALNSDLGGMRMERQPDGSADLLFFANPMGFDSPNKMRITSLGAVGIETNQPRDALEVAGSVRVFDCVKNNQGSQIAGTCPSDERLKTNIEPFPPVLEKAVQLQPVRFDWRADEYPEYHFGSERSYGLIAQEVEKVLPELVSTDKHGFKAVNYSELPLVLLQALRDLNAENQQLKSRLAAIEELLSRNTATTDLQ